MNPTDWEGHHYITVMNVDVNINGDEIHVVPCMEATIDAIVKYK